VTLTYSATPDDVGALFAYGLRHSWRFRLTLAAYAAFPGLAWLLVGGRLRPIDLATAALVAILAFFFIPFVTKKRTKTAVRALSISPDGIATTIGPLAGIISWSQVYDVWDGGQHIFIVRKNLNGFAIPTSAFGTQSQRAEFLAACREYTRPRAAS